LDSKAFILDFRKAVVSARTGALILTHVQPDGDAIGSAIAVQLLLQQLKVKSKIIWDKINLEIWKNWETFQEATFSDLNDRDEYAVVITVDCSTPDRLGDAKRFLSSAKTIINIDHHTDNTEFGTYNWVQEASSVGELIDALVPYLDVTYTIPIAEALLVSIITDTGRFKHNNTTAGLFLVMNRLVSLVGQKRYHTLITLLYAEESLLKWQLISQAIQNMTFIREGIAFSYISQDSGDEDGLVDPVLSIKGVRAAVLARPVGDIIRLSFRAKDPQINVRNLAQKFGGGGHIHASGASMVLTDFSAQVEQIKSAMRDYFNE
jgi:phosphoesterase RecJ-like protein